MVQLSTTVIRIVVIVCYFRCSVKTLDAMCGSTLVVCLFQIKLQKVLFQPLQMFFTVNSVDLIVPTRKYNLFIYIKRLVLYGFCSFACFFILGLYCDQVFLWNNIAVIWTFFFCHFHIFFCFIHVLLCLCNLCKLILLLCIWCQILIISRCSYLS